MIWVARESMLIPNSETEIATTFLKSTLFLILKAFFEYISNSHEKNLLLINLLQTLQLLQNQYRSFMVSFTHSCSELILGS